MRFRPSAYDLKSCFLARAHISGAFLEHTTIYQLLEQKREKNVKMVSFERRGPNLKYKIESVAVCRF